MAEEIVYLDNNATTQVDERVLSEMLPFQTALRKVKGEKTIRESFGFLLNGHLRDINVLQQFDLSGDINIIKAGSVWGYSKAPNSYNIVQID